MFFRKRIKIDMKLVAQMNFTSKTKLKQYALMYANGDLEYAAKIYDFLSKDMEELPIADPIPPTRIESVRNAINGGLSWIKDNEETIMSIADRIRSFIPNKSAASSNIPQNPLPPIN